MLRAGRLANIERYFVRGGVEIERAIAMLPPVTYPNTGSLLTGRSPAAHGVTGMRWLDRETLRERDYESAVGIFLANADLRGRTLFECLGRYETASVLCHTRRGATRRFDHLLLNSLDWLLDAPMSVDRRTARSIEHVARAARHSRRWPVLIWLYFPGVDKVGHHWGPASREYQEALVNCDDQIGRVIAALERTGLLDRTWCLLVTDHGHVPTPPARRVDLADWLRSRGLRVRAELFNSDDQASREARARGPAFHDVDVVLASGAGRHVALHVRGRGGWLAPADQVLLAHIVEPPEARPPRPSPLARRDRRPADALRNHSAVGLLCLRAGPGRVRVLTRCAEAMVEDKATPEGVLYRYVPAAGDPLGYLHDPVLAEFVQAGWHSDREWLAATADSDYPDFVPQIADLFDSPRAGDVLVFAAGDWSFDLWQAGGHGSALSRDMCVSVFIRGPDVPAGGKIPHARLIDLAPTILDLLGEHGVQVDAGSGDHCVTEAGQGAVKEHGPLSGLSLAEAIRTARLREEPAPPLRPGITRVANLAAVGGGRTAIRTAGPAVATMVCPAARVACAWVHCPVAVRSWQTGGWSFSGRSEGGTDREGEDLIVVAVLPEQREAEVEYQRHRSEEEVQVHTQP